MTKAEPLKPQAWMVEAAKALQLQIQKVGAACPFSPTSRVNYKLIEAFWAGVNQIKATIDGVVFDVSVEIIAAHAPSGSPPTVKFFDCSKCGYYFQTPGPKDRIAPRPTHCPNDGMELVERGSVASQEAVCPACGSGDRERAITQLNSLPLSVCPHKWHRASQEAAQPIPSIADVSDHNPNDPSCTACGSAMGWKCLSCGSTTEPTQKAAQPTTGFPIDKTDDWEERQDRARQEAAQPIPKIVYTPRVCSGQPTVKGVPCFTLAGRFCAGDTIEFLADDFDITTADVIAAIRHQIRVDRGLEKKSVEAGTPAKE